MTSIILILLTSSQVGYTLTTHHQIVAAKVDKEVRDLTSDMKKLTQNTVELTEEMKGITEENVDDSVTVKVITIVSAVYIPGSFAGVGSIKRNSVLYN